MTWGELRSRAQTGDAEAQKALRTHTSELADLVACGNAATQHARSELQDLMDEVEAAATATARRKDRRERAMLVMTAASVLAAIVAALAAILH
jgi:polyhydroxyalkanoate synthesis regulator phasin